MPARVPWNFQRMRIDCLHIGYVASDISGNTKVMNTSLSNTCRRTKLVNMRNKRESLKRFKGKRSKWLRQRCCSCKLQCESGGWDKRTEKIVYFNGWNYKIQISTKRRRKSMTKVNCETVGTEWKPVCRKNDKRGWNWKNLEKKLTKFKI